MILEFAKTCHATTRRKVLIVCPLMVVRQTCDEAAKWYGDTMTSDQLKRLIYRTGCRANDGPIDRRDELRSH
jgi:hypothetical protein